MVAIGRSHEIYIKHGVEDFTKRISNYYPVEWILIPVPKNAAALSEKEQKIKEAELFLDMIKTDDHVIALDESGKQMSSEELAGFLMKRANESIKRLVFVIGGAFGLSDDVQQRAQLIWSLSLLTFPHQLVRLILAEQLYRACTINRNEKYHHK